jgi:hypothetical protein
MAQYEEFTIDQGSDVAIEIHCIDGQGAAKNLSNFSPSAKLKKTYTSSDSDTTSFTAIVSDTTGGVITLSLTNTQTDALSKGRYVYDVELSFLDSASNTIVERILEGRIQVTPSVTK